jgi:hypothetical protein
MEVLEAVSKLALVLESSYEFEDYGSMESYSFSDYEMEVQSEYGIVTTVCFGHYWNGDEPLYTMPNRVAGDFYPPAPTPPIMRLRNERFISRKSLRYYSLSNAGGTITTW